MPAFNRLDKLASRAVDRVNGIRFDVQPGRKSANGRTEPDPDRLDWHGRGILEETPINTALELGNRDGNGNDLRSIISTKTIELSVDLHRWSEAKNARQGDRLQTDDLRRFEINSVKLDGASRLVFRLSEITTPPKDHDRFGQSFIS